ncbi:hypothetical protein CROQUDRAFT_642963 [Cronartium quercuum f. sp. fusiforme G11]|uniref:Uncharacterized protein n=1 Tax=Cronartium quercuum f. sp. fusiforme G11 TaxID=708437 RepID=A0A9P6NDU1_9BASI|nr:hypothetical protein CROQUDRAFT_642963 [Cronartium quercuum f. sp. fusiforme G11]
MSSNLIPVERAFFIFLLSIIWEVLEGFIVVFERPSISVVCLSDNIDSLNSYEKGRMLNRMSC